MKKSSIILIIMLVLALFVVLAQFAGTYDVYSRYNTNWNGTSDFFAGAQQQYIYDYADLSGLQDTTLLIIVPSASFKDNEKYLKNYISRGNTVIIVDQQGYANTVLKAIGSDMRVSGKLLKSADQEYNDAGLFKGNVVINGTIFGTAGDKIFVNYPSYVTGGIPVLTTSQLSWEFTGNTQDMVEMKTYSLAAYNSIGNGKVLVIADPSLFINSMQNMLYKTNRAFLDTLQKMPGMYLEQKYSATAHGGGIFGFLQMVNRYPAVAAALIAAFCLGCGVLLFRHDREKRE